MLKYSKGFTSLLTILALSSILLSTSGNTIQGQDRIITRLQTRNDPVKITLVKTKKGKVVNGQSFTDDDEWFKGLTISVGNASGKNIIYVSLEMLFPREKIQISNQAQTALQALPFSYTIDYGWKLYTSDTPPSGFKPILAGDTIDISVSDRQHQEIKAALEQIGFPASIKKIRVRVEEVLFEDGTIWDGGTWFRRDPNDPKKLYLIDPNDPQKLIPIKPPSTEPLSKIMPHTDFFLGKI